MEKIQEEVVDSKEKTQSAMLSQKKKSEFVKRLKQGIPFYIIALPTILVVFCMRYLPMFGLVMAFKDYSRPEVWDIREPFSAPWAAQGGFANFINIFTQKEIYSAITNTLMLSVLSMMLNFPAPIVLALLMTEISNKAFKKTVQTISFLPHFLSWIAITGIVNQMFNEWGLINAVLRNLDMDPISIFDKEGAFIPTYMLTSLWQSVGWGTILYLSTIAGISPDLYEAAKIDGANRFQQVMNITLPALLPVSMIQLIIMSGGVLGSNFELVFGLQNNVAWKMEVISTWAYRNGIDTGNDYGMTTALSLFQGVIALILTMTVNMISKKVSQVSMW